MTIQIMKFRDGSEIHAIIAEDVENVSYFLQILKWRTNSFADKLKYANSLNPELKDYPITYWGKQGLIKAYNALIEESKISFQKLWEELIDAKNKKEQIAISKDLILSADQIFPIFLMAENKGFIYSEYHYRPIPKAYEHSNIPIFMMQTDSGIEHIGNSDISKGQMKNLIEQKNEYVARIMTKGNSWFSLFSTFRGITGQEPGLIGKKPHMHFISGLFGIPKEDFINNFKKGIASSKIHIPLINYPKHAI